MSILHLLSENKGTVSSALSKELAQKALSGDPGILNEAIDLATVQDIWAESKSIRSGAAKIVEIVAEKKPDMVAPLLDRLLPALSVSEPQTRWMIIRIMGFCAHLNEPIAENAIPYAQKFIQHKEGLCLSSSADLFLGDYGSISSKNALKVFPLLKESAENLVLNEHDWLLEAFQKIYALLDDDQKGWIRIFAGSYENFSRKSTRQRAGRILNMGGHL